MRNILPGNIAALAVVATLLAGPGFAQHYPSTPAERAQTEQLNRNSVTRALPARAIEATRDDAQPYFQPSFRAYDNQARDGEAKATAVQSERLEDFSGARSGIADAPVNRIGSPRQLTLPPGI